MFEKINEVIDENCQNGCSSDSDENCSEAGYEEFKHDISASTIQKISDEGMTQTVFSEEVMRGEAVVESTNNATSQSGGNYRQTDLKSYFKK